MGSTDMLKYLIFGTLGLFAVIAIAYYIIYKKMQNKTTKYVAQLVEGTKESSFSMEVFYQNSILNVRKYHLLEDMP